MTEKTTIFIGGPSDPNIAPPRPTGRAIYFDGDHAVPQEVTFSCNDADGTLVLDLRPEAERWPYDAIRELRDQAGDDQVVMRLAHEPTARLIPIGGDAIRLVQARAKLRETYTSHVKRSRIAGWALAAVASVALIIFVLVPVMADHLAIYLPPEGEKALGDATFEQIRDALDETGFGALPICDSPKGLAVLAKIEDRLTDSQEINTPLTVHVLDHGLINAFALPGGYVVFFDGLLEAAKNPEEVAAVFAHEIGHVQARDPTRIALRSAGSIGVLGLLFGDFAGGALVLFLTEQIIQADYT